MHSCINTLSVIFIKQNQQLPVVKRFSPGLCCIQAIFQALQTKPPSYLTYLFFYFVQGTCTSNIPGLFNNNKNIYLNNTKLQAVWSLDSKAIQLVKGPYLANESQTIGPQSSAKLQIKFITKVDYLSSPALQVYLFISTENLFDSQFNNKIPAQ